MCSSVQVFRCLVFNEQCSLYWIIEIQIRITTQRIKKKKTEVLSLLLLIIFNVQRNVAQMSKTITWIECKKKKIKWSECHISATLMENIRIIFNLFDYFLFFKANLHDFVYDIVILLPVHAIPLNIVPFHWRRLDVFFFSLFVWNLLH